MLIPNFGSVEISWGLFFILVKYCLLRIMKNDYLNMLASLVLPAQILDYFLISGVEQTSQEIHISLDAYSGGYPFSISGDIRSVPS